MAVSAKSRHFSNTEWSNMTNLIQQLLLEPHISQDMMQIQMLTLILKKSRPCLSWTLAQMFILTSKAVFWSAQPPSDFPVRENRVWRWIPALRGGAGDEEQESFHTHSSESQTVLGDSVHIHCHLLFGNIPTKGCNFKGMLIFPANIHMCIKRRAAVWQKK